jgi:hypothetical protein
MSVRAEEESCSAMPNLLPDALGLRANGRLIWFTLLTFAMIGLAVYKLRQPKPDRETTWAEAMAGAVYTFALFLLMYAIVPHEFITAADKNWNWSTNQYIIKSTTAIPFMKSWNWPFSIDMQHGVRDPAVVLIYVLFFAANIAMFVLWQKRPTVSEAAERADAAPAVDAGRSRFGRPLKAKA